MKNEMLVYVLIVVAILAMAWVFMGRGDYSRQKGGRDARWRRLPGVFRLTWSFSGLFEESLGAFLAGLFRSRAEKYRRWIAASDLPLTPARVFAAAFCSMTLCTGIGLGVGISLFVSFPFIRLGHLPIPLLLLCVAGWCLPGSNLGRHAERRQAAITRELPFAIDLIGAAMRAGLDFGAALRHYVENGSEGPLVEEFSRVLNATQLGQSISLSIGAMAERVQIGAFSSFAGVISYGAEIGAPITQTLLMHGEDLRRERFHLAERKAARAPALMIFPLVLFLMPSVFIVIMTPMFLRVGSVFAH